jgi:hypothetical protein
MLRESVSLVADTLEKPKRVGVPTQADRLGLAGSVNLFLLLGQRKQNRRLDIQQAESVEGRIQLPFAPIDQNDVGKG